MYHEEKQLSIHDAATYYDDFRREKEGYVEAELGEVKSYEAPHAGIVLDVGERRQTDFQAICDGFVTDHSGKASPVFVIRTRAFEIFVLLRRPFHPKSPILYIICPPFGCKSPCTGFP